MNMTNNVDDFSDLDDLDNAPTRPTTAANAPVSQPCLACAGSGKKRYGYVNVVYYPCPTCKGEGKVTASRLARVAGAKRAKVSRATNLAAKIEAFKLANVDAFAWLEAKQGGTFNFANSLWDALNTYGSMTENQLAAVHRMIAQDAERKVARAAEAKANETQLDAGVSKILDALNQAASKGLKAPKMRTEHLNFALAKATSKNPGCVYVTTPGESYIGKITPVGVFAPTRDCTPEQKALVVNIAADPLLAAVAFGRMTGRCSCCGRELTDPESVRLGIGPICMGRYF